MEKFKNFFEAAKEFVTGKHELNYEAIESLREPTKKILEQLRKGIDNGEYNLIIGDDASGRIPTLIFNKVLKALYEKRRYELPKAIFLAGSGQSASTVERQRERAKKEEMIEKYLGHFFRKEQFKPGGSRALIVTDIIVTGNSLKPLANALHKKGIEFDIANIGTVSDQDKFLGGKIFSGGGSLIYGKYSLGGVYKHQEDLFSIPIRKTGGDMFAIKEAREDVKNLSEDLVNWYNAQKNK